MLLEYQENKPVGANVQKGVDVLERETDRIGMESSLRAFYAKIYPCSLMQKWLGYNNGGVYFGRREFSFTLCNEVYTRFQSFTTWEEMLKTLERIAPSKIDIGSVYNVRPSERKTMPPATFRPIEKELVFDIDITDYDDIRTCCRDKDLCSKCWVFIDVAINIMNGVLKEDFGFKHILWVFSGRRGVHCWVCDKRARMLDVKMRKAIVSYVQYVKGGPEQAKKVVLSEKLHPSTKRAFEIMKEVFRYRIVVEQDILDTHTKQSQFLSLIDDKDFTELLKQGFDKLSTGKERWDLFCKELEIYMKKHGTKKRHMDNLLVEIMFQYCYPRLDTNVTVQMGHLLKSPFCVHPSTLNICIPLALPLPDPFDPSTVPTLFGTLEEVNNPDIGKRSFDKYLVFFKNFVDKLQSEGNLLDINEMY